MALVDHIRSSPWEFTLTAAAAYLAYRLIQNVYLLVRYTLSPVRKLPGPRDNPSFLYGHIAYMLREPNNAVQMRWIETYGATFSRWVVFTSDARALTHVLFASHIYQKTEMSRQALVERRAATPATPALTLWW